MSLISAPAVPEPSSAPAPRSRPPRLHHLDGLRAVAALAVAVNHCYQQIYWTHGPKGWLGRLAPWFQLGHISVTLFIVLSGFCLMLPVLSYGGLRGGVRGFYAARARRILPAYWAATLIALGLILTLIGKPHGMMFDLCLHPTGLGLLGHLLLVNNLWPPPTFGNGGNVQINGVFWSVALEWQIYFWFPLFLLLWRRTGPLPGMALVALAAWGVYRFCQSREASWFNWVGINPDYYAYFAAGMLAATLALPPQGLKTRQRRAWQGLAAVLAAGFVLLYHGGFGGHPILTFKEVDVYCVPTFVCLLVAASQEGRLQNALSWRPLVRVGEYSYSVYLLHLPLIALITDYAVMPLRAHGVPDGRLFLLLLALALPTVLFVAYRFSLVFENKRVIARALEWISRKPAPQAG